MFKVAFILIAFLHIIAFICLYSSESEAYQSPACSPTVMQYSFGHLTPKVTVSITPKKTCSGTNIYKLQSAPREIEIIFLKTKYDMDEKCLSYFDNLPIETFAVTDQSGFHLQFTVLNKRGDQSQLASEFATIGIYLIDGSIYCRDYIP